MLLGPAAIFCLTKMLTSKARGGRGKGPGIEGKPLPPSELISVAKDPHHSSNKKNRVLVIYSFVFTSMVR